MAETTGKQQRQPGKDCPVCAERIKAGARRCRYCGSSLSWREHLGLGNTILALLVALVSVVTAAVPTFYNLFSSKNSDLNIAFVSTDSDKINWMVTNVGNRPGVIGNGYVKFTVTDELSGLDEAWMVSTNPQIVQPNGTAIISQTLDHSFLQNIWRAIDHAETLSPGHRLIKSDDQRAGWIGVTVTLPSKDYRGQRSNTVWNGYLECIQDSCLFSSTKLDFDVADLNAATNRSPTAVARDWHAPEWRDGAVRASPSEW